QNFVCEHPGFSVESIQRQVRQYVNWLDENFKDIVIKGIKRKDSEIVHLPLEQVFAPLEGEYQEMPGNAMGSRKRASTRQAPEEQEKHSVVLPLHRALSLGNRIVITGGPGCGKSTVLIYLAWKLAHAWKDGTDGDARAILGFEGPLPLPVYLPLSQYARYLRDLPAGTESRKKRLDYFIADYMEERHQTTDLERTIGFISHLLEKEENLLVLLDGLDEVPTVTEREQVSQAIEELVSGRQFLRVVATSRTAAFTGNVVLGAQFKHLRVLPMKSEHIEGIVRASYQCIYEGSETLANEKAAEMLEQIESVEAQRKLRMGNQYERLVDTPLMARIFLIIHHGEAHLPEQRAELYKKAVEVLLRPDYAVDKRVTQDIERRIGESPNVSLGMHQHLAFQMHSLGQEQGREISEEALRDILSCDPTFSPHVDNLVHVVTERGTLLEKRDKLFRFQHLSFQEYLVGRALVQTLHEPGRIADFFEKGPVLDSWWREPALLMAGYLNMEAVERLPALLSRLARLEELPTAEKLPLDTQLAMAELAAAAYLECIPRPAHLAGPLQERLKALVWLSEGAPRRHADAAEALDRLGWTPGDLHTFVEVPGAGVWIGKYPVTNGQYARFVEAQDFAEPQYWQAFPRFGEPPAYEKMEDWGTRGWDWLQSRLEDKDYSPDGKRVYPRDWDEARFGKTRPSAPVVGVSWFEANAYCRWLQAHWAEQPECRENKSLQPQAIRLPLEREWAAAAGGEAGERYAWDLGKAASELAEVLRRANVWESGIQRTTPVWAYPLGASPWGVWDLSGNVWEWQANYYDKDRDWLAWRGGSWSYDRNLARCAARHGFAPYGFHDYLGFRLVCSPSKSEF
ncbi:MAG: SUMF1/EgtB/PvdO family nonheme iron enzyme, partial [Anaerolineales bacterium]|nr:SUMF1/EgtB/PvdO family nonheme iron enzyme [Anaerolineales bacterium]